MQMMADFVGAPLAAPFPSAQAETAKPIFSFLGARI
jgi:hypothetical protein